MPYSVLISTKLLSKPFSGTLILLIRSFFPNYLVHFSQNESAPSFSMTPALNLQIQHIFGFGMKRPTKQNKKLYNNSSSYSYDDWGHAQWRYLHGFNKKSSEDMLLTINQMLPAGGHHAHTQN